MWITHKDVKAFYEKEMCVCVNVFVLGNYVTSGRHYEIFLRDEISYLIKQSLSLEISYLITLVVEYSDIQPSLYYIKWISINLLLYDAKHTFYVLWENP